MGFLKSLRCAGGIVYSDVLVVPSLHSTVAAWSSLMMVFNVVALVLLWVVGA
jgi:hypothetical protein